MARRPLLTTRGCQPSLALANHVAANSSRAPGPAFRGTFGANSLKDVRDATELLHARKAGIMGAPWRQQARCAPIVGTRIRRITDSAHNVAAHCPRPVQTA